jgi:polar amino acid transport system substrate-binding protein
MIARSTARSVNCPTHPFTLLVRSLLARILPGALLAIAMVGASHAEPPQTPLRVAVYDVAPYGYVNPDGSISGISVDLWRRVAERLERHFKLIAVSEMDSILGGLEQGQFDAAIGAITITAEREKRVDFSYPAHRSGVAIALRRDKGPLSALESYATAASELSPLILGSMAMLVLIGIAMWFIERGHPSALNSESSVVTLRDGLYWAIVTMTTVGYGDKTPKSTTGRVIAVSWMFASLVWVSLLSTSLVSRLTAERVEARELASTIDLAK